MPPKSKSKSSLARAQPTRLASKVQAITASGGITKNFCVWSADAPSVKEDPSICYAKCLVLPGSDDRVYKLKQIEPPGKEAQEFECKQELLLNCNEDSVDPQKLRDIGLLTHQNTAAVLDFLRRRFMADTIYTTADPLLVAVNPFKDVGNCTDEWIARYRDTESGLPPHTFAVAKEAMRTLHNLNKSQTIIVTGESGAGKTEATKHCMRFFASAKSTKESPIQKAVMAANPVLEAFGNAKTIRNNNSSRFGRFMQLVLGQNGGILNGKVIGFLLEKVRVCSQSVSERSYHIFYQFLKGATPAEREEFLLLGMKDYAFLNKSGGCYDAPGIDDIEEWKDVRASLVSMSLSDEEIKTILRVVSGVLLLGNVEFQGITLDGQDNAADLDADNRKVLANACSLLSLEVEKVAVNLCMTDKQIGKDSVTVRIQKQEAKTLCESLAKAMYDNLFRWIIDRLNGRIAPGSLSVFMGMLDIFGFEIFERNSLEQLLINITNEFLQKNFTDIVFEKESRLYRDEGVSTAELVFTDNKHVIDSLIDRRCSVFACLSDACVNKGGSDASFYSQLCTSLASSTVFKKPQGGDRDFSFTIAHTIADITYCGEGFLLKNMDLLKPELAELAKSSSSPVVAAMFADTVVEKGKLAKGQLIASQFLRQLDDMMAIILATEPHFIRCVKPNETKKPLDWDQRKVLNQLFSLSILEALQLKKLGFSWRRPFSDFAAAFRYLRLDLDAKMRATEDPDEQKQLALQLLTHCKILLNGDFAEGKHWQVGKTMVFLKPECAQDLLRIQRQALEDYRPAVSLLEALWLARQYRKDLRKNLPTAVRLQCLVRKKIVQAGGVVADHLPSPDPNRATLLA